ncbi:MAG: methyltransferase [Eubacteriales bacterium]|nr:methyltransferase [Eubacteriales bacterium]MDD4421849.1 methyltransferase [Eubacteriales bacterium]
MITTEIKGIPLEFITNSGVFSPSGVDKGTLSMLSKVEFLPTDKVLDLGCGYGVVGILASKLIGEHRVIMCDISEDALELAKRNAVQNGLVGENIFKSDGLDGITEDDFTLILSNPPYNADFSVAKRFIEKGFTKLASGGKMIMVTKRCEWYRNKLKAIFGNIRVDSIEGYYVFTSEKTSRSVYKKQKEKRRLSKKLEQKLKKRKR